MLNQRQESAGSSTPPRPELNPLLNPLLADNMQRWADVYFSTPPEQREQAVRALLEELREEQSTVPPSEKGSSLASEMHSSTAVQAESDNIRCTHCGQGNPQQYQYCGSCGGELKMRAEAPTPLERDDSAKSEWQSWEDPRYSGDTEAPESHPLPSPSYASAYNGLSFLRLGSEAEAEPDAPDFMYEAAPSHSYRIYLGLFLAIVIGGLGYKAWKATKGTDGAYTPAPPPVSASDNSAPAKSEEPASPATPDKSTTATENKAASVAKKDAVSKGSDSTARADSKAPATEAAEKTREDEAVADQPSTKKSIAKPPARAVPNGSEELATAQEYLSRRNTALAAPWLWKSVSKHNGPATLLLADLYLKGDGVSKNCDQARILLDSAARKGVSGAGERLRHLAAFGCQ